jgi:DNA-binding FadR family transcriptional regulator
MADRLREHILELPEGTYLGSEDDLARLLGVGRHTLRQTARLLEHQRLLKVKRGVGGGYYGMRPDIDAVADAAATYLRTRTASTLDLFRGAEVLDVELARLSALATNDAARDSLKQLETRFTTAKLDEPRSMGELDFELRDCLFALAANPFIELMLRVHVRFTFLRPLRPGLNLLHGPERLLSYRQNRLSLIAAILDRDADIAVLIEKRFTQMVQAWVLIELELANAPTAAPASQG